MKNPRRMRIMAVNNGHTTDDPWHPDHNAIGSGTTSGTRYGATETEADNVFAEGGASVLIHEIRVDKGVAGQLTLFAGAVESGADAVAVLQSSTTCDAHIKAPFLLEGGFHVSINTNSMSFSIVYEIVPPVSN